MKFRLAACALCTASFALTTGALAQTGVEPIAKQQILSGAQVNRPVFVTHAPGDHSRIFIVEQKPTTTQGRIRVYDLLNQQLLSTPFITITGITGSGNEQGLLGLAFHPNYAENGYFYVYFTQGSSSFVRRYTVSQDDPNVADTSTAKTIITIPQNASNHNGGWIAFGLDGYLYIATGDGGGGGDPNNFAQNLADLRGKILRIDVNVPVDTQGYLIPSNNPFVGQGGVRREIWAYGLRNPWRNSFDRLTGDLYIGDVGQNTREEVSFQHADSTGGENYGWKCYEGNNSFSPGNCPGNPALSWPFHTYNWSGGYSVIGGYVYRGCAIPTLDGTYFFANLSNGNVWSLKYNRDNQPAPSSSPPPSHPVSDFTTQTALGAGISNITSFGEDAAGEIYITTLSSGVHKIVPQTPTISFADLDCNGSVGVPDLLALLAAWGDCFGCKEDFDGSGSVGVPDLLELLAEWG